MSGMNTDRRPARVRHDFAVHEPPTVRPPESPPLLVILNGAKRREGSGLRTRRLFRTPDPIRLRLRASSSAAPQDDSGCRPGFTLIELLVVIVVIALLLAIFISVMGTARERGQRAVCLSNLRHLTLAWVAYADQNDGNLVSGSADAVLAIGRLTLNGWAGQAFTVAQSRSALIHDPRKGPLWPYLNDIDIYRCARGREGHALTYSIVAGAKATR